MAFGSLQGIIGRAGGNEVIGRGVIDVGVSSYRIRHDMRTVGRAINTEARLWGQAFRLAAVGIGAVVAAGTAVVVGAVATAEKFNASMAKIAAMTGVTTDQLAAMKQGVLELAKVLSYSPTELADALYFISSAGFRGVEALQLLDQAARAAAASGSDLKISADALVSVMNAFGLSADQAQYASNILTKTVTYGKVEFEDLARAIGPVSTISRVAGIELEEMGAALSMLTTRGLSARRATNSLWATLRSLSKPTEQQWKMMKNLKIDFKPEDLETKGLITVLRTFDKAVNDWYEKSTGRRIIETKIYNKDGTLNVEKSTQQFEKMNRGYFDMMGKLVGQSNAFLVSQILLQEGVTETYDFYYDKMKGFGDTTNEAYEKAKKLDFGIIFGEMTSNVQVALIALGEKFLPTLRDVIEWLGVNAPKAIEWFSDVLTNTLFPALQSAASSVGKLLGAIGDVLNFGGEGGGKSPLETAMGVIVNIFTYGIGVVDRLSDALAGLLSNSMIQQLAKMGVILAGISIAFSGIRTASNGLASRLRGVAGALTFGRVGGSTSQTLANTTGGAAGGALLAAAQALQLAAAQLQMAAVRLGGAGAIGGIGQSAAVLGGPQLRNSRGQFMPRATIRPINFLPVGQMGPVSQVGRAAALQASMAGRGIIGQATAGLVGGLKVGMSGAGRLLSLGIGAVSKLFMPLLITDLVGNLFKEPLGDILGDNPLTGTFFKEAGAAMKEDFWGGVMLAAETLLSGGKPDMYRGLAEKTKIGNLDIDTMAFKAIGVDAATVKKAQADELVDEQGNPYPLNIQVQNYREGDLAAATEARTRLEEQVRAMQEELNARPNLTRTTGSVSPWAQAIYDTAKALNLDVAGVATFLENGEIASFDISKIKSLVPRIAERFDGNIASARDFILDFIATNVAQSGDTKFNKLDLMTLAGPELDSLVALVTEDVDGQYTDFRTWYTNQLLAAAKGVPKTSADFGTLPTKAERQDAAVAENVKPLSEKITALSTELAKIKETSPETFKILNSFLDQYGEKIEDAGTNAQKWLPIINEVFADDLGGKKFTSKTFAGADKKKGTKDDIIKYYFGGKEVTVDDLAAYWRKLDGMVISARDATGADLSLQLATEVGTLVQTGLADGMSIEQIRKGIPDDLWMLFINSIPGGEQAEEVLAGKLRSMWGGIANKAHPSREDKKKVINSFKSMFSTDDDSKISWKFVKKLLGDPAELQKWIAENIATTIPKGIADGVTQSTGTGTPATTPSGRDSWWADALPKPTIPPETLKQYSEQGKLISVAVAEGVAYAAPLEEAWYETLARSIGDLLPNSPPPEGPLAGAFLLNAGKKIVSMVGEGIVSGGSLLGLAMSGMLARSLGKGSLPSIVAWAAGYNVGNQVANGLRASIPSIALAIARIATALANLMPHGSPAKAGPFRSWAWNAPFKAGANLTGQMTKGLMSKELKLPGLEAGATSRTLAMRKTSGGSTQKIYADKIQLFNADDEDSILKSLQFMAPGGR